VERDPEDFAHLQQVLARYGRPEDRALRGT
jgi:hypothetical protein